MKESFLAAALGAMTLAAGCAGYTWGTSVPAEYRTVAVPVFENLSEAAEMGPTVTQYTLREFQREGSFKVARTGEAAIEVQGVIRKMVRGGVAYDRGRGMRATEYRYMIVADVSFVDKLNGKVLLERKGITGETTFLTQNDLLTGQKNATARIAQDIARQIVNEAVALKFPRDGKRKGTGAVEGVQK
jgi:hypothetical protein